MFSFWTHNLQRVAAPSCRAGDGQVLYTVFIVNPNVSSELKHDAALASPGLDSKELAKFLDVALHLEGDAPQMPVAHSHFVFLVARTSGRY